jgi:hypothetical protein
VARTNHFLLAERAWKPTASLDNEFAKNYRVVVALSVRASFQIANLPMTVL